MGQLKATLPDGETSDNSSPLPETVFILMEGHNPVGVYMYKGTADYDAWLANMADEAHYTVRELPLWAHTEDEVCPE